MNVLQMLFRLEINWDNVLKSLQVMGFGMIGILVVMVLIYLLIFVLNKTTSDKKQDNNDD
mgnify:FL=1